MDEGQRHKVSAGQQTFEDLREQTKMIERTASQLRKAEAQGDLFGQMMLERRLLRLIGVPDPGVY